MPVNFARKKWKLNNLLISNLNALNDIKRDAPNIKLKKIKQKICLLSRYPMGNRLAHPLLKFRVLINIDFD